MRPPELSDRLAVRARPPGIPVMRQRWSDLLFLHWAIEPERLRPHLPPGLNLDLHRGVCWLGIVPFFMERIRPRGLFPVPGLSWFLELNVRCYVHDDAGVPGVWFHSLDCNQPLAVAFARRFFHLPYQHAAMNARRTPAGTVYQATRRGAGDPARFHYAPQGPAAAAEPGTLEFFLAERYLLYAARPDGALFSGQVHHSPYLLAPAACEEWSVLPARWDGLELPATIAPASALHCRGVDVEVYPLRRHPSPSSG